MEHTAEQHALTRKLRVDLQGSGLFGVLLLKYRLLNRQIVHISRRAAMIASTGAFCSHSLLKAVQRRFP